MSYGATPRAGLSFSRASRVVLYLFCLGSVRVSYGCLFCGVWWPRRATVVVVGVLYMFLLLLLAICCCHSHLARLECCCRFTESVQMNGIACEVYTGRLQIPLAGRQLVTCGAGIIVISAVVSAVSAVRNTGYYSGRNYCYIYPHHNSI